MMSDSKEQGWQFDADTPDGIAEQRCTAAADKAWRWAGRAQEALDSLSPSTTPPELRELVEDARATADALADDASAAIPHGDYTRAEHAADGAEMAGREALGLALKAATIALHEMDDRVAKLMVRDEYNSINMARRQQRDAEQALLARVRACREAR